MPPGGLEPVHDVDILPQGHHTLLLPPHDVRRSYWFLPLHVSFVDAWISLGLKQQRIVKWTQYATIVAYVAVIAVVWGHCTPVHKNWQVVPYPGDQCTLAIANYLALVVLNIRY